MIEDTHETYANGIPTRIDTAQWSSLAHLFDDCCQRYSAHQAFTNLDTTLTYAEVDHQSRAFAAWLRNERGLVTGDRIALMMPNCLQYIITLLGALRAGLVVINANPLYTARELEHQLNDSGARAIVVLENFAATLEKIYDNVAIDTLVTTRLGDFQARPKRLLTNFTIKAVKKEIPEWSLPNPHDLRQALARGAQQAFEPPEIGPADLAFLQYTGGTTGPARGAMLSHGNLVANVCQCQAWLAPQLNGQSQPTIITALPIYHIFALTVNVLLHLCLGGKNVLITDPRNMNAVIKTMARHPFTGITGVNTLFSRLLDTRGFHDLDFSRLQFAMAGGMATQKVVAERWAKATGQPLIQGYGLSEASPVVSCNPPDTIAFDHSVGLPLPNTRIRILDDQDEPVAVGDTGELCVHGPQVMQGYWQRTHDDAFTADGFLRTGDIARQDAHGHLFIIDRKNDTIVVSGFKVYPNEIEDVIATHPGIKEAACIRVPDEQTGEAIKLFVVKQDPELTMEAVRTYCRTHLTGYKIPRHFAFIDTIPKSNVGKILRRELR